jgi:hydroxylamine reductase
MKMFCNQCEQTARGVGCDIRGVCGKAPEVASLLDILIYQLKGIGYLAHKARALGATDERIDRHTIEALFTTVTNVNFSTERLEKLVSKGEEMRSAAVALYSAAATAAALPLNEADWPAAARGTPAIDADNLADIVGILAGTEDQDLRSLRLLLLFGIKGIAAYADHALLLGEKDDALFAFMHEALAALSDPTATLQSMVALVLACGTAAVSCMALLDKAHTARFGNPVPTSVRTGLQGGPSIVVSGHDLLDLEELLKQTAGRGVMVYTHGEMLPAHGYPGLSKYPHLAGHFGTAWQNQQREFDGVPAAFLFTTNCIQKPLDGYRDRVFTAGLVAFPGVVHVENRNFEPVIRRALELSGGEPKSGPALLTGCGHHAVLSLAEKVIALVNTGKIRRFLVIGGCDGAKPGRNYYTDLADAVPADCVIITLACGKFRFNGHDFGTIDGIPRLLDAGQCNDAHSVITVAQALASAFKCGLNDLPVSIILSWYEQKAVAVLLALLSLGFKGIRIGPSLPAFLTPNVLKVLVDAFDLKPIGTAQEDLAKIMGNSQG